ncbi:glycine-rich RNA-binding protein [Salix suchowensis]|nr:glycine-rich RNA-binding protein [Salix suchowensis]
MATSTGITRSSRIFFSQPQLQSQPLLLFPKDFLLNFAAGLSFSSTEKKIVEAFSEFGKVIEAKLVMDKARNRPKGYGFVTFAEKEAAEKACEGMNGKLLDGRAVYVRF